ncbi:MAG: biotin--[acetyl-CoA-carboxylase] ligase [candidate division NC10 bacterium]|nr:biotin--[acetyl-CoA-carboxylase] ligase [candidate division NC10 bacterium]
MRPLPGDLAPELIQPRLRTRLIARPLEVVAEIGSTNDAALAAGRAGAPEGFAVLADRQTAGRGRRGRAWASPSGVGLYTSVLLRPEQPPALVPLLTLVAGLAVAEAIREVAGLEPLLKWPNDVLVHGRKVAGILTEMASLDARVSYLAVGMGVNVNHGAPDLPEDLLPVATSLRLVSGRTIPRCDLAVALYNSMDRWYQVFRQGQTGTILAHGRQRSATLGESVDVLAGEERWRGRAVDLDADGALLVQEEGGAVRRVQAGDVSIRTPDAGS